MIDEAEYQMGTLRNAREVSCKLGERRKYAKPICEFLSLYSSYVDSSFIMSFT